MMYRITDITNFIAASSCATIIQAAKKLEISQPALSESLKRLEKDLGYILFYRSRSGIQLTPTGKIFLLKALKLAQAINHLDILSDDENIFSGRTITIGCHPTVAQYSIPKALAYLKTNAADYKIELRHDLSRNIQAEIQRGHIDIGVVINPTEVPDLVIQKLAVDTVGVWTSKTSEDFDTIICNLDLFQTQSILKKWKNKPGKIISTDSLELICRLVDEKVGYGIIPERAVILSGFALKNIKSLPSFKDEICLLYRPEFGKDKSEKMTIAALKKAIIL
jgi:DNA-binding transcriptional LysR family regulator